MSSTAVGSVAAGGVGAGGGGVWGGGVTAFGDRLNRPMMAPCLIEDSSVRLNTRPRDLNCQLFGVLGLNRRERLPRLGEALSTCLGSTARERRQQRISRDVRAGTMR